MRGIIIPGQRNALQLLEAVNDQALSELPGGRWQYRNVGSGIHVDPSQLDPFLPWTYIIENESQPGQFAVIDNIQARTSRAAVSAWDRIPGPAKAALKGRGKFPGNRPTKNDNLSDQLGAEWFPEIEI